MKGRLLARNGAVTLINDTVTLELSAQAVVAKVVAKVVAVAPAKVVAAAPAVVVVGNNGGGGENGSAGPIVRINGVPRGSGGGGSTCVDHAFTTTFTIHDSVGMRQVRVFLDGKLIRRTTAKHFSVRIGVAGLRTGSNTIRVVAVDKNGRRDVAAGLSATAQGPRRDSPNSPAERRSP